MEIRARFCRFIEQNKLFRQGDRVLLGVSGGRDSMLMLWLFQSQNIPIEVAHCNFHLRGAESTVEEEFVRAYCATHHIPFHVQHFATEDFANEHKISIQMAARQLRYDWFDELAGALNCAAIAVAHHKKDQVETVLLNLARGTGLAGLQGILPKRGPIIRPLLFLDAEEVTQAVQKLNIPYKDDSSNFSNKYARNKIRLDIIPEFEQLQPDFIHTMTENIARFREAHDVLQELITQRRRELFRNNGTNDTWAMDKAVIQSTDVATLYYLFEPFGFSKAVLTDLCRSTQEPGRVFESPTHDILLDRDEIILQRKQDNHTETAFLSQETPTVAWKNIAIQMEVSENQQIIGDSGMAKLDYSLLSFPLQIRNWQKGDYFRPLGMRGKKKLSDFFIQKKINRFEKQNTPLVVNGNGDILWVVGYQIDDRYKITENTQKVLTLVRQKREI